MKKVITFVLVMLLTACSLPLGIQITSPNAPSATPTPTGAPANGPTPCVTILEGETITIDQEKTVERVIANGYTAVITCNGDKVSVTYREPMQTSTVTLPPTATIPAANPTANLVSTTNKFDGVAEWTIQGALESVDPSVVLQANGDDAYGNHFDNTVSLGSQMMIAEPGTLLVGPDFDPNTVANSNGHIDWISPITQQMLGTETFSTNTAEGAFTWATGAKMTVEVDDFTITVNSTGKSCSNNWFVMIRGLFADSKQDSDRNTTTHFSNYVPGHTQVMWYPAGAYISEGNFLQVANLSHTDGRNCGNEGTSGLSVLMLDLNTGAYTILFQANLNQPWQFIASNWFTP